MEYNNKDSISTSSDEQYRITKMIDGSNGMSYQEAVDEEIDNGIDEEATLIELTFNKKKLQKIYNNGNPMTKNDRKNCLTLDGRSKNTKKNKKNIKGRYGIGGANARARLSGQGKQTITSTDNQYTHSCIIDLENLQDEDISPKDCWTSQYSKYKPQWKLIENDDTYCYGVTKEYNDGENKKLKQRFTKEEVIIHLINKYSNNIQSGLEIIACWNKKNFKIPNIYSNFNDLHIIKVNYNEHNDKVNEYCFCNINDTNYHIKKLDSGIIRTNPLKNTTPKEVDINKCKTLKISIKIKHCKKSIDHYKIYKKEQNGDLNTDALLIGELSKEYINNLKLDEIEKYDNELIINCQSEKLSLQINNDDNKKNKTKIINNDTEYLIEKFIPSLIITHNNNTLCYKNKAEFNRFERLKGGDIGSKIVCKVFIIEIDCSDLNLSQENKNNVNLPETVIKTIQESIKIKNNEFNKKLKDNYIKDKEYYSRLEHSCNKVDNMLKKSIENKLLKAFRQFDLHKNAEKEALKQKQEQELAEKEALKQKQDQELAEKEALKQKQDQELAEKEALKQKQYQELAEKEALKQKQYQDKDQELAEKEALKHKQDQELAEKEALKHKQDQELAEKEALKHKQDQELAEKEALKHKQDQELAEKEALKQKQDQELGDKKEYYKNMCSKWLVDADMDDLKKIYDIMFNK